MPKAFLRIVHIIIRYPCVRGEPVVPERNRSLLPFDADLEILSKGDVLEKQLEDSVRLFVFEPDDALSETRVHKKRLLASSLWEVNSRIFN